MKVDWGPCLRLAKKASMLQTFQEIGGVRLDQDKARTLMERIDVEVAAIEQVTLPKLPPRKLKKSEESEYTLPKKPFKKDGSYSELMIRFAAKHGATLQDDRTMTLGDVTILVTGGALIDKQLPMDLGDQIALKDWLIAEGWEPTLFNYKKDENGKVVRDSKSKEPVRTSPKMQENGRLCPNLETMQGDLVKPIVKYLSYKNRYNVIKGWLANTRLEFDGRLTAGSSGITNTFRQRHQTVTNVPKNKEHVLLGKEMRELFVANEGEVLVGYDASSLEDRIKGHLTYRYDGGTYAAKILTEGYDPHQENADLWSIDRSIAKNGTYALGYFCGVKRLAATIKCSEREAAERHESYWKLNDALKQLDEALGRHWEANGKQYIVGLDGRKVHSRHRHGLVNLAIQSSASILMDWAGAWMDKRLGGPKLTERGFGYLLDGKPVRRVVFMHDEYVYSCHPDVAKEVAKLGEQSILKAGEFFELRVPLVSTAAVGTSWADLK